MRKYIPIGAGGAAGAILRFLIRGAASGPFYSALPLNTLAVNIAGCFFVALVIRYASARAGFSRDWLLGISVGLIGAFTTFSTMCKETIDLLSGGQTFSAIAYVLLSAALGSVSVMAGIAAAAKITSTGGREQN